LFTNYIFANKNSRNNIININNTRLLPHNILKMKNIWFYINVCNLTAYAVKLYLRNYMKISFRKESFFSHFINNSLNLLMILQKNALSKYQISFECVYSNCNIYCDLKNNMYLQIFASTNKSEIFLKSLYKITLLRDATRRVIMNVQISARKRA